MTSIPAIAVSGMSAAQFGLQVSAHNIANLNTADFTRQEAVQTTEPAGGVSTLVTQARRAGSELETDVVGLLQAKNMFFANLAVFRASDRMTGSLIDAVS